MADRFITPGPLPTAREREILIIIIEEAAEVQHRAAKALRFGLSEVQPGQRFTNADRLAGEVGDLFGIVDLAVEEGVLCDALIRQAVVEKRVNLEVYMQTQPPAEETE